VNGGREDDGVGGRRDRGGPPPGPSTTGPSTDRIWLRLALFGALGVAVVVTALVVGVPEADRLREDVDGLGGWAPLVFVLGYAAITLLPLPKNVLSVAAGLLFGLAEGVAVVLPGAVLGAVAAFGLGRALGRGAVERFTGVRVARVDAALARRGVVAVLVSRLIPVLPFTGINYAAGLTAVRFRDFLLGTAIGVVPGTVAYVAVGAYGTSPTSRPFLAAVAALLALSLGGTWWVARRRRVSERGGGGRSTPRPSGRTAR
jgi:uncharacterized membrane protein YdjX (TVP38/TMEM64 family)